MDKQAARDLQISSALNTLATILDRQGRYEDAEQATRRAIEIEREAGGQTPDLAMYMGNLGVLRRDRGDLAGARTLHEEAGAPAMCSSFAASFSPSSGMSDEGASCAKPTPHFVAIDGDNETVSSG